MLNIKDEKIKKYIDELGEEYKEILFNELIKSTNDYEKLKVSELLRLDCEVKEYLKKRVNRRNNKLWLLGFLYVLLGICMYLITDIMDRFQNVQNLSVHELIQLMSITISFVGVAACMMSLKISSRRKNENVYRRELVSYEVISTWRDIEGLVNDIEIVDKQVYDKSVITLLENEGMINKQERELLTNFLKLRNSVIYGSMKELDCKDIYKEINRIRRLVEKINNRISPKRR